MQLMHNNMTISSAYTSNNHYNILKFVVCNTKIKNYAWPLQLPDGTALELA